MKNETKVLREPRFFLLGAPKCGTTSLASYFKDHPLIYPAKIKEPHYFCKDLKAGGLPASTDLEYVQTFFPGLEKSEAIATVDTSVWYLYSKVAVKEILKFNPNARFIVMLRNPVDMVWSLHSMFVFQGQEDRADFMAAWQLQDKRKEKINLPEGLWLDHKMLLYKDVCSLGCQLQLLFDIVEKERVHIAFLDDFKKNPRNAYLHILNFMNVPDDGRRTFQVINAGRKIKNPWIVKLFRTRGALKTAMIIKRVLRLKTLGIRRPDPVMTPEIRKFLINEFSNEIRLIEKLTGRDLTAWYQEKKN